MYAYSQSNRVMKAQSFLSDVGLEYFSVFSPSYHLLFLSGSFNTWRSSETSFKDLLPGYSFHFRNLSSSLLNQRAERCCGGVVLRIFTLYFFQQGEQIAFVSHIIDNHFWEEYVIIDIWKDCWNRSLNVHTCILKRTTVFTFP